MEKTFRITKSNHQPYQLSPITNHVPQCNIHAALKYLQGWGFHNFPGQLISMFDHILLEEILPNVQFKASLAHLKNFILSETNFLC